MGFKGQKVSLSRKGFRDQKMHDTLTFYVKKLFYKSGKGLPWEKKVEKRRPKKELLMPL